MLENDRSSLMEDDGESGANVEEFNRRYETSPTTEQETQVNKWALRGRLRSKTAWAATVGVIIVVFSVFNIWEKIGITVEGFREIATAIGAMLAEFGVFNDPTNREGF